MKKIMAFALFLSLTQAGYSQHVHFGVKAGVNSSSFRSDDDLYKSRIGFHAGLLSHIHIVNNWALQPELLYSLQGAEVKNALLKTTYQFSYINVPVLVQYMFDNGFRLETGPQAGILVSAERKINDTETDVKDGMNTFDFAWAFGIGYITKSRFVVDVRYNLGINDVNDNGPGLKNSVLQAGLFYQFSGR